jgi:uncharacterized membrane protein YdbT with pleckstrin-like domain
MGYVEHILQPGEEIKHVSRLTWILYFPGFSLLIIGFVGLMLLPLSQQNPFLIAIVAVIVGLGGVNIFHAWFRRWTTEIAVTNRRVIYKRGFIRRHTIEMNMDKIESVHVDQSIMGRIFNYGTVTVHGTGTGIEPLQKIDSPIEFRNNVTAQ